MVKVAIGTWGLQNWFGGDFAPVIDLMRRADEKGVGMDRTVESGTGFIGQYPPDVAKMYESLDTGPDDLILFLHHVPYTYKLHSGKTVIQSIYDSHYAGEAAVDRYHGVPPYNETQQYVNTVVQDYLNHAGSKSVAGAGN